MNTSKLLIASTMAVMPMIATAADRESRKGKDATAASVATLEASLGHPAGLEIDEVRLTDAGVACIDYRLGGQGGNRLGHAVVRGDEVLNSASGDERFEKEWNEHCLGPRGGITSE
jgi:hypothetical protein